MTITPGADLLEIVPISDHEWRVSDVRVPPADRRRVVAQVERLNNYVMVTWLPPRRGWAAFPDLDCALRALRLTCAARPVAA